MKKPGGQIAHKNTNRLQIQNPEKLITILPLSHCILCNESLGYLK